MLEPGKVTSPPAALRPQVRPGLCGKGSDRGNPPFPGRPALRERRREPPRPRPPLRTRANQRRGHKYANGAPVLPECRSQGLVGSRWGRNWPIRRVRGGAGEAVPFTPPLRSLPRPRADRGPGRAAGKCRRHPSLPPTAPGAGRKPRRPRGSGLLNWWGEAGAGSCHPGGRRRPPPPGQPRVSVSVESGAAGAPQSWRSPRARERR